MDFFSLSNILSSVKKKSLNLQELYYESHLLPHGTVTPQAQSCSRIAHTEFCSPLEIEVPDWQGGIPIL